MNIDLRLDAALVKAVVEGATEKLLMQNRSTPWNNPSNRKSLTPDDHLSSTRLYFREYFRGQSLCSTKSLTPTPPSSRSPTPGQDTQKSSKNGFAVAQLPRDSKNCTIKKERRKQDGITRSRRPRQKYHSHSMITRSRSLSMAGSWFFDLEHPPSSKETYRWRHEKRTSP